jgi:hypothetical protein
MIIFWDQASENFIHLRQYLHKKRGAMLKIEDQEMIEKILLLASIYKMHIVLTEIP